ncbi:MAG: lipoprotein-releasing ABC transporter permease subunit [Hyphomicrobiaceae bacterium]|nr:lipoprotein-releasing ABC transporter permease subunit [Hyphomicrobiaceae bacterium]
MSELTQTRPFAPFEWMIAGRYLRARRKEGFISVIAGFSFLGIMLGVATLIIVLSVMNGFRSELFDKILGLNGHIVIHSMSGRFTDYDDVAQRLRKVEGVKRVLPLIEGQAMVSTTSLANGALIRGMSEESLKSLNSISDNIRAGTLDGFDGGKGIAMGTRLANQLRVKVGDKISLLAPRGATTPFGTAPRVKRYTLSAIFEMGMSEYDNSIIFMPLREAQRYFNKPKMVSVLEVLVDQPDAVGFLRPTILEAGGPTIYVTDWRQRNASFFSALQVERNVMFLILTLIVLVAALNIISGLIMLVKDKGADIAILRTMGATRGTIMRVFFITGASIGVVGTLAGLVLGIIVCLNAESIREFISYITSTDLFSPELYYLSQLPAEIDPGEVVTVVVMALVLSVLATLYPSWRASTLDPVEALRYE